MTEIIIPNPAVELGDLALRQQRRITKAFIDRRPETIEFVPRVKVKKPAGGWVLEEQTPRLPQIVTFVEQSALSGTPRPTLTLDGVERKTELEIVAEWDASLAVHDVFSHQGKQWEIIGLFYDNKYEARAWVAGRG